MKTLVVFETLNGEWCAGTASYNLVYAATKELAIKLWKEQNKGERVKIRED